MYAQAKPSPLCGFVNSVEHSHMHLLMYYLWLCLCYNGVEQFQKRL